MFRLQLLKVLVRFSDRTLARSNNFTYCQLITKRNLYKQLTPAKEILSDESKESEKDFVLHARNDPDLFGGPAPEILEDDSVDKHAEEQVSVSQKLRTKQYADMIKEFIKRRKIKEALDVLEVKMLKEDQVKPENYIYNLLLGACGTVGYTKKAFSLYNRMKQRGLKPTGGTYTALFNACANSPWKEDGLTRAHHLRNIMIEKMVEPNDSNYNAMIKAFGRCGDLATAFSIVDEMIAKRLPIRDDTMNFVLQACITDKEAGFRHSLIVWRKMMTKRIRPSAFTFNLMLRAIRDCGIGDVEVMQDTFNTILKANPLMVASNTKLLLKSSENKLITTSNDNSLTVEDNLRPNLMARVPHLGNILGFSEVKKAEDRLLLVGGVKGILDMMEEFKCQPDIKTFTILLDCLPASLPLENELINNMRKYGVKPDLDFYNMLIKKRSFRFDYENARNVVEIMEKRGFRPDLITYGVLAMGCKTSEEANELIEEMKSHSYRLNTEILGAMLNQACHQKNFHYVLELMELCIKENIPPNKKFIQHLNEFKGVCRKIVNDKDHKLAKLKSFIKGYTIFKIRYKTWCNQVKIEDPDSEHPWTQFRQTSETATNHIKVKTPAKFKPRHISRFRVKTSAKHRN